MWDVYITKRTWTELYQADVRSPYEAIQIALERAYMAGFLDDDPSEQPIVLTLAVRPRGG